MVNAALIFTSKIPAFTVNGNEVRDVNTYKDTMTFRVGYATYTIKTNGHGSWNDSDAGNAGKIVRE